MAIATARARDLPHANWRPLAAACGTRERVPVSWRAPRQEAAARTSTASPARLIQPAERSSGVPGSNPDGMPGGVRYGLASGPPPAPSWTTVVSWPMNS